MEIKTLLEDEPTSGLERAVWWTEYVIRNKGAPYFRNRSVDMSWYNFLVLDVFIPLLSGLLLTVYIFFRILKFFVASYRRSKNGKVKVQ